MVRVEIMFLWLLWELSGNVLGDFFGIQSSWLENDYVRDFVFNVEGVAWKGQASLVLEATFHVGRVFPIV